MRVRAALLALALMGCKAEGPSPDGYWFESGSTRFPAQNIKVITYPDKKSLLLAHPDKPHEDSKIVAFAVYPPDGHRCAIHIVDPAVFYDPAFFGHELTHCIYGQWHPNQP